MHRFLNKCSRADRSIPNAVQSIQTRAAAQATAVSVTHCSICLLAVAVRTEGADGGIIFVFCINV